VPGGDLGVDAAKGVKGVTFPIGIAVLLVLELPMGPRMAHSIFFWANPNFRSANILVFLTGLGFLSFSKGILTIMDFLGGVLGDLLGDLLVDFFFLPKGSLTMSFDFLGDFLFGEFLLGEFLGKRIRSGDT
jgi:hypothetical protein